MLLLFQVVSFRKETGEYLVDYSKFNATHEVQTPLCSSRDFIEYQKMMSDMAKVPNFVGGGPAIIADNSTESGPDSYRRSDSSPEGRMSDSKATDPLLDDDSGKASGTNSGAPVPHAASDISAT